MSMLVGAPVLPSVAVNCPTPHCSAQAPSRQILCRVAAEPTTRVRL